MKVCQKYGYFPPELRIVINCPDRGNMCITSSATRRGRKGPLLKEPRSGSKFYPFFPFELSCLPPFFPSCFLREEIYNPKLIQRTLVVAF